MGKLFAFRMYFRKLLAPRSSLLASHAGFTLVETMLVIGVMVIMAILIVATLYGRKGGTELDNTNRRIATLLREAQSRSMAQASSTNWGIHLENSTNTTPFYALFYGTYSTSSRIGYYALPADVGYATSTIASGAAVELSFAQITGTVPATTSITLFRRSMTSQTTTITVTPSGAVSF
ncbi:MAG: hypothetical protein HY978_01650 [Candidatus Liptonbacteria bacterium]|nr:hypothetical protein [Candidatus Liptonbacteria bacterium]